MSEVTCESSSVQRRKVLGASVSLDRSKFFLCTDTLQRFQNAHGITFRPHLFSSSLARSRQRRRPHPGKSCARFYLIESAHKSFCKNQFPHKSVKLSFIVTNLKDRLTDLCWNCPVQDDLFNTFWETRFSNVVSGFGGSGHPTTQTPKSGPGISYS